MRATRSLRVGGVSIVLLCGVCCAPWAVGQTATSGASSEEVRLEYKFGDNLAEQFGYMSSSTAQLKNRPDQPLKAEPKYSSRRPLYGQLLLGAGTNNRFPFAWDESRGTNSGYDTFHVDVNQNGDLTDDPKVQAKPAAKDKPREFPIVELALLYGAERHPYHVKLSPCGSSTNHIHLASAGYCEGQLMLGGKTCKIVALDDNGNGNFGNPHSSPPNQQRNGAIYLSGDALLIDVNGDGVLKRSAAGGIEMYHAGRYLSLDNECYTIEVAPDGRSMRFGKTDAPCGSLAWKEDSGLAELLGDSGAFQIHAGSTKTPAGKYRLVATHHEAKDAQGRLWAMSGRGSWELPAIEVRANETTEAALGMPVTAEAQVTKKSGSEFQFSLQITGKGGEKYSAGDIRMAGSKEPPPAPKLEVRDQSGKIVAQGQFEYG